MRKFLDAIAIFLVAVAATIGIMALALVVTNGEKAEASQEQLPEFDVSDIPYKPEKVTTIDAEPEKDEDASDEPEGGAPDMGIFPDETLWSDEESVERDDTRQVESYDEEVPGDEFDEWFEPESVEEPVEQTQTDISEEQATGAYYTNDELLFQGEIYDGDTRYTYYSESVLPGGGLDIPGRHVEDGYVMDENGNVCVASCDFEPGTQLEVPFGNGTAVVYDECEISGTVDIYVE